MFRSSFTPERGVSLPIRSAQPVPRFAFGRAAAAVLAAGSFASFALADCPDPFSDPQMLQLARFGPSTVLGDVNNNGILDLIVLDDRVVDGSTVRRVGVHFGDGEGSFDPEPLLSANIPNLNVQRGKLLIGDLNGNGALDLVVTHNTQPRVYTYLGNGDGTFVQEQELEFDGVGGASWDARAQLRDVNDSGALDLIVALSSFAGSQLHVLFGEGDGTFAEDSALVFDGTAGFILSAGFDTADVNHDGTLDIVFSGIDFLAGGAGILITLAGDGGGNFEEIASLELEAPAFILALADASGDGNVDVVLANDLLESPPSVVRGSGDGTFSDEYAVGETGVIAFGGVADVNGNGIVDIFGVDRATSTPSLYVFAGDGFGGYELLAPKPLGDLGDHEVMSVLSGDLTENGFVDVIALADDGFYVNWQAHILLNECGPDAPACPGDLDGNDTVDVFDLLILLAEWGACADPQDCPADLTGNGVVDVFDLLELLAAWGPC